MIVKRQSLNTRQGRCINDAKRIMCYQPGIFVEWQITNLPIEDFSFNPHNNKIDTWGGELNQIEGEESYNSSGDGRLASGANGSILA